IHRDRASRSRCENTYVPLPVEHLCRCEAVKIGIELGLHRHLALDVTVAEFLGLVAVMPADPAPMLEDMAMVEELDFLEGRNPDLRMLAQHLGKPRGPRLLRADAQGTRLARFAVGIEGGTDSNHRWQH